MKNSVKGSVLRKRKKTEEEDTLTAQTLESQGTSLEATILQPYKLAHKP